MSARILFIGDDDRLAGWWDVADGRVVARGGAGDPLPAPAPERVIAVAPASAVGIHVAAIGRLPVAQARAAARLMIAETSLAGVEAEHVAVAPPEGDDRIVMVVAAGRMADWIAALAAHGLDPDAIVPAALLLPRPDQGFVAADIGGTRVLRSATTAFADDPALTPLIVGDAPVTGIDPESALLAALEAPLPDLRQGPFARRAAPLADWARLRRLAILAGIGLALMLVTSLVEIWRLNSAATALEAEADAIAARAIPGGTRSVLAARLAAVRGGGQGFSATTGALYRAVQASPNVELAGLEFAPDGALRATLSAPGAADVEGVRDRLRASGLSVEASPFQSSGGRIRGELRINGR